MPLCSVGVAWCDCAGCSAVVAIGGLCRTVCMVASSENGRPSWTHNKAARVLEMTPVMKQPPHAVFSEGPAPSGTHCSRPETATVLRWACPFLNTAPVLVKRTGPVLKEMAPVLNISSGPEQGLPVLKHPSPCPENNRYRPERNNSCSENCPMF